MDRYCGFVYHSLIADLIQNLGMLDPIIGGVDR